MTETITISNAGAVIPHEFKSMIANARQALTQYIEVGFPKKYKVPVKFCRMTPQGLVVPPTYITRQRELVYTDLRPDPDAFRATFLGSLFDQQRVVTKKALLELTGSGCATLVMPTGTGKTVCALYMAAQLGLKPVILVHKTFLAEQWKSRIEQYVGPDVRVSMVKGSQVDTSGDIVVGLIQTFVSKRMHLPTSCGTLIIDEAHHIAAKQFRQIIMQLMTSQKYVLGLSATPDRKDGIDIRPLLGDYIQYADSLPDEIIGSTPSVSVNMHMYSDESYLPYKQPMTQHGDVSYANMVTAVSENVARTAYICSVIEQHQDRYILVLSHRRKHCGELHECLKARGLDAALFLPSRGKGTSHEPPDARIIVSTFNYVSEGFDVPRLDCVVFATPASNLKQSVGRVLRRRDHSPLIVDICDAWGVLNAQTRKRRSYYQGQKYMINTIYTKKPEPVVASPEPSKPMFISD
jgi:superfamily II DNA or RNA helicase